MNKAIGGQQQGAMTAYQLPAIDIVNKSIAGGGYPMAMNDINAGTQQAVENYKGMQQTPMTMASQRGTDFGSSQGQNAWADLVGATHAPLEGYNQFQVDQQIKNLKTAQQLGILSNWAQMQAQTTPLLVRDARDKWQWMHDTGQIMQSAVNLAAGGGGGGGGGQAPSGGGGNDPGGELGI